MRIVPILLALLFFIPHAFVGAQVFVPDVETLEKARVVEVSSAQTEVLPGTGTEATSQTLTATVLSGEAKGSLVTFRNDFTQLSPGDVFYLRHLVSASEGTEFYSVADPYRLHILIGLAFVFVVLIVIFGGIQGIRGLGSLIGSLVLIALLLLPGIQAGYPPVLVSIGVASIIIVLGSYVTHGFNRTTTAAVLGMLFTIVLSGIASWWIVGAARLSGYASEHSTYLHFQSGGTIDLAGVLLGGILIGLLGVLYDIAIGQAVAVEELMSAGKHLSGREIYLKALRIGREHIGALVNTLAIAYVGAALPLFLLLRYASASWDYIVNGEVLATEIVRILVGGCGVILAVPVTTALAVLLLSRKNQESTGRDIMQAHHH